MQIRRHRRQNRVDLDKKMHPIQGKRLPGSFNFRNTRTDKGSTYYKHPPFFPYKQQTPLSLSPIPFTSSAALPTSPDISPSKPTHHHHPNQLPPHHPYPKYLIKEAKKKSAMSSNNQTHYERLTPNEKLAVEIATRLLAARKNITGLDLQTLQARVQVCLKDFEIPEEVATKPRGLITAFGWQRAWFCDWVGGNMVARA